MPRMGASVTANAHHLLPIVDADGPERFYCEGCLRRFRFADEADDSECPAVPLFGDA